MTELRIGDLVSRFRTVNADGEESDSWHGTRQVPWGVPGTVIAITFENDGCGCEHLSSLTVRWETGHVETFDENREADLYPMSELMVVTPQIYVNVYHVEQRYGGPEEGGWWWDSYEPVESVLTIDEEEAGKLAEQYAADKNLADHWGVSRYGRIEVRQEPWPGEPYPTVRPHYC